MKYITIAKLIWKRDEPLPVDLHIKLTNLGYDVEALERRYRA